MNDAPPVRWLYGDDARDAEKERRHALDVYERQRTYAERMYDPLTDEEESAKLRPHR